MRLYAANAVQDNVNWVNDFINNASWDRLLAILAVVGISIFLLSLFKRWITIGQNPVEQILKQQLEAANLSLAARDTDTLNEINKKLENLNSRVDTIQTMLVNITDYNKETAPLIRSAASEVGNISDEIRDLARRGGGRGVI